MVQHLGIDRVLNIISGMARRGCNPWTRSHLGLFYNFTNRCSLSVTILNRTKHLDLSYLAIILIFFWFCVPVHNISHLENPTMIYCNSVFNTL
jgi:hypothetical protein